LSVLLLAATAAAGAMMGQAPAARAPSLDLVVPQDKLPAGCSLAPQSVSMGGNRVRRLWLGVPANPWRGTDPSIIASIRSRMGGLPPAPDGPPLSAGDARRYFLELSEGIDEGFVASYYMESDGSLVTVHALTFADSNAGPGSNELSPRGHHLIWLGPTVAMLSGDGRCFDAVEAHLRSLAP